MKAISRRHKMIGGVFAIVSAAWALDMLSPAPGPSPADAATAPAALGKPVELLSDPVGLEALIESLRRDPPPRTALRFEQVSRDPFAPTGRFDAILTPLVGEGSSEGLGEGGRLVRKPLPFEARHELQGILTGPVSLALIDGLLVRRGVEIDGYRLIAIHTDSVVFEQGREQVTLHVSVPGSQ
jgi:hypothetical protein